MPGRARTARGRGPTKPHAANESTPRVDHHGPHPREARARRPALKMASGRGNDDLRRLLDSHGVDHSRSVTQEELMSLVKVASALALTPALPAPAASPACASVAESRGGAGLRMRWFRSGAGGVCRVPALWQCHATHTTRRLPRALLARPGPTAGESHAPTSQILRPRP